MCMCNHDFVDLEFESSNLSSATSNIFSSVLETLFVLVVIILVLVRV